MGKMYHEPGASGCVAIVPASREERGGALLP